MLKRILLHIFIIILPSIALAQPGCKLSTFTMADGLPSSTISTSAIAPNGMLWIATWNGLCNYDGYRFNSFIDSMGAGQVLTSNRLYELAPTNNGDVWITTFDHRLYKLSAKEQKFIDFQPELEEIGLHGYETSNIIVLPNDVVWILGMNGTNVRIEQEKMDIEPTGLTEAEVCLDVKLVNDKEWIIGEKTFRLYKGKKNYKAANAEIFATKKDFIIVSDRVYLFKEEKESLTHLPLPQEIEKINACCQHRSGDVILATNAGLYSISNTNNRINRIVEDNLTNIFSDSKERLWSILENGEVLMINSKSSSLKRLTCIQPESWPEIICKSPLFHEDLQSTVWLNTSNGSFCYYDEKAGQLEPIDFRTIGGSAFPMIQITKEISDSHKNLWFTMSRNLYKLSFYDYSFHYTPTVNNVEMRSVEYLGNDNLLIGSKEGHLALASTDGTIKGFYSTDGKLHPTGYSENLSSSKITRFSNKGIYSIYRDKKGEIWVGTRGEGLYKLTGDINAFNIEHLTKENTKGIASDNYFDITEDTKGRLWFGTYQHGFMLKMDDKFYSENNCKAFVLQEGDIQKIRRISCTKDGIIWMSTADGIININENFSSPENIKLNIKSYNPKEEQSLIARDVLQTLCCEKSQSTFVSTMGGGVQKLETNEIITKNETGNIFSMIEDNKGFVWAIGENTIHRFSPEGKELNIFSSDDWGKDIEMSEARSCYDRVHNTIFIPVMGGIISFCPENMENSSFNPSIVFSGIQYQGDESITPLLGNDGITLPTDKHNAMIFFSALDYSGNTLVRYAYRIKEIDREWTYVGAEHCAPLSNLPSGEFTLEVRSTNNEGIWMDNNTEIKIKVLPTFWQTPWAIILYIFIVLSVLYALFYIYKLRNTARVEKEIKERQLRFFTNISHQLRTPLTLIGGPVAEVLKTEKLSDQARNYLQFVENNSERMLSLVDKSLDLNKLQQLNADMGQIQNIQNKEDDNATKKDEKKENNEIQRTSLDATDDITILVVEDNDELRYFLSTALSTHYKIIEAENGKIGLKLALEKQPDFIITDIMMPEMDGITMIKSIKADNAICHIPIIILSARTADVYRIEGLQQGADDYITKPFSIAYLQLRVESIIHNRKMLQETWRNKLTGNITVEHNEEQLPEVTAKENKAENNNNEQENKGTLSPADARFVELLTAFVEDNIGNEDLIIEDIAKALGISRSVLYGKVKTIFGYSPNDFLKNLRISRACHLLVHNPEMNISEVAYSVGFTDPKYFARNFKQNTGMSPSEYRKNN